MNAKTFLHNLQTTVHRQRAIAQNEFKQLSLQQLNYKPGTDSWSILECLEHLNRYSRYYNPALAKAIANNSGNNVGPGINYSWLGKKSLENGGVELKLRRAKDPKQSEIVGLDRAAAKVFELVQQALRVPAAGEAA